MNAELIALQAEANAWAERAVKAETRIKTVALTLQTLQSTWRERADNQADIGERNASFLLVECAQEVGMVIEALEGK